MEPIAVIVRSRPFSDREKAGGTLPAISLDPVSKTVIVVRRASKKQTRFHGFHAVVAGGQHDLFEASGRFLVDFTLLGFTTTMMAYGQVSTRFFFVPITVV